MPIQILLVEDDPGDARLVEDFLRGAGDLFHPPTLVTTLGDAEAHLRDGKAADVVLLDLSLPDSEGLETLENILRVANDIPVVVMTGALDERLPSQAVLAGAQDFVPKATMTPAFLERAVRYAIDRKQRETEQRRAEAALSLLQRLTLAIARAESLDTALSLVLEEVCRTTGWATGESWLPNPAGTLLERGPTYTGAGVALQRFHAVSQTRKFSPGDGLPGRVWASGEPLWAPDVGADEAFCRQDLAREACLRAAIIIPVLAVTEVTAVLAFYLTAVRPEDERHVRLVAAVAAQLGALIARKRSEQSQIESEARFRLVLQNSPVIVSTVDRDLRYVWLYNPHPRFRAEEALGKTDAELAPYDHVAELIAFKRDVLDSGIGGRRELRVQVGDEILYYDATAEPVRSASGEVIHVTVVATDITERKAVERAESLLAEAGEVFGSSLELRETLRSIALLLVPQVADWCVINLLDETGKADLVKVVAADAEKEELLRQMLERFPHPASPEQHPVGRVLQTGEPLLLVEVTDSLLEQASLGPEHLKLIRRLAPRSSMIVPLVTRGRILGAMTLTATEAGRSFGPRDLKVAEELARRAALAVENARNHQRARRAVRSRDEVLGVVAHDLRNPLAAIDMYANLLEDSLLPGERNRKYAQTIRTITQQANRLIEDLLNVSRLEAGALRMEVQPVPARALVDPTMETLSMAAATKGVALDAKVLGNPPMVLADPDRISQVLSNLVGNSLKFTPAGGRIAVRAESSENEVHFSVSDDGPGIPPEHLSHIFDRFWQGRSYSRSGAGLGLSIVKGIVDAHGGRVWAESEVGRGSTFSFALPIANPHEGQPESRCQPAPAPGDSRASGESITFPAMEAPLRVLVVDDHPAIRRGLVEQLRTSAYVEVVGESSTGEEALEMVGRLDPGVVLMDLEMPGMGGIEAICALHSRHPGTRVIALTADSQEESLLSVMREGGSGFMRKSDAHRDLIPALAAAAREEMVLPPGGSDVLLQGDRARSTEIAKDPLDGISEQERAILGLAAEGFTSREIGKKLFLSPHTVDTYRSRSMRRLGISNRPDLVRFALRNGLLTAE